MSQNPRKPCYLRWYRPPTDDFVTFCERRPTVRLSTLTANICSGARLPTVDDGCERSSNAGRTQLQSPDIRVKGEPFATHSGKLVSLKSYNSKEIFSKQRALTCFMWLKYFNEDVHISFFCNCNICVSIFLWNHPSDAIDGRTMYNLEQQIFSKQGAFIWLMWLKHFDVLF